MSQFCHKSRAKNHVSVYFGTTYVSVAGFEPTTSTTPKWRATGLRYTL
jgi:hypothetical protein